VNVPGPTVRPPLLHITNGESAANTLRQTVLGGAVLPWQDALHEGPVPALPRRELLRTRARFLADCGWGRRQALLSALERRDRQLLEALGDNLQVVLWFEHDLYDQLQLIQILDRLALGNYATRRSRPLGPVELVVLPRGPRTFLRDRLAAARSLSEADHALASRAWVAFTASDPHGVQELWLNGTPGLPDLAPALGRLLEEHPATTDGLARTDRQILAALADAGGVGASLSPALLFGAATADEERPFLGDTTLWWRAARLAPLVARTADGAFALTGDGARVVAGGADAAAVLAPLDRWVGGVHHAGAPAIRWDPAARRLRA
jgi:hypothetical protein